MSEFDFDLFVIGAGSGGVRASRLAASYGAKVAVAEDLYLGGTCVNVGCVPKKLFAYAAHFAEDMEDAHGYGWNIGETDFTWSRLLENKNREITRLNGIYRNLLSSAGVTLFDGRARFVDSHTVAVGDKTYTAERILIATGGWPHIPTFPGSEHVISSNEVFFLETLPKRVLVVGGGYIAIEFASIFHGLGCDVCLSGTDMHTFSQRACWGAFLTLSPSPVSALRLVGLSGKELGFSLLNRFEFEHIPTSLSSFLRV